MRNTLLLQLLLFCFLVGCQEDAVVTDPTLGSCDFSSESEEDYGEVLATVNGQIVGSRDLASRAKGRVKQGELTPEVRQELLDELISETLIYQDALQQGYSRHEKVRRSMVTLIRQDRRQELASDLEFEEEELIEWYTSHLEDYLVPENVRLRRILVKITPSRDEAAARAEIERLHASLTVNIGRFTRLARRFSEDPHRNDGGNLGSISRQGRPGLDAEVVEIAFEMEPEILSDPIRTREGFNLLFVDAHDPEVQQTFVQVRSKVLQAVQAVRLKELQSVYIDGLRGNSSIEIDQDKLMSLEL